MSGLSTALYLKNIPGWERALRLAFSLGTAAWGVTLPSPWSFALAAGAVTFALTGLFGFCPACALLGRRPVDKAAR